MCFLIRTGEEAHVEDGCQPKLKTVDGQTDNFNGKKSTSQESLTETDFASESNNSNHDDPHQPHKVCHMIFIFKGTVSYRKLKVSVLRKFLKVIISPIQHGLS